MLDTDFDLVAKSLPLAKNDFDSYFIIQIAPKT